MKVPAKNKMMMLKNSLSGLEPLRVVERLEYTPKQNQATLDKLELLHLCRLKETYTCRQLFNHARRGERNFLALLVTSVNGKFENQKKKDNILRHF